MTIATILRSVANWLEPAIVAAPAPTAVVAGAVTYGEVTTVLTAFGGTGWTDLSTAWAANFGNVAADEAVTLDALKAVAPYWPPAAAIAIGVKLLPVLLPLLEGNPAATNGLNPTETDDPNRPFSRGR